MTVDLDKRLEEKLTEVQAIPEISEAMESLKTTLGDGKSTPKQRMDAGRALKDALMKQDGVDYRYANGLVGHFVKNNRPPAQIGG